MKRNRKVRDNILGAAAMAAMTAINVSSENKGKKIGTKVLKREKKRMLMIFFVPLVKYMRKSYRMHVASFHQLHQFIFKTDAVKR